jgi:hypothetical protein
MQLEITQQILLIGFAIAFVMGAVVQKTNFCTMGGVSDWVNMGDTGRMGAWLFAIAIAIAGVLFLEGRALVTLDSTLPPYRSASFAWARYLLGGLLFGVGMTLGSGCGNRNMVRIGGGNLKSLIVLAVIGVMAYLMTKTRFYELAFHGWINPLSVDLAHWGASSQEMSVLLAQASGLELAQSRYLLGGALVLLFLVLAFRSAGFRSRFDNILGGAVVGLAVLGGWYVTGGSLGQQWLEAVEFMDTPPIGVGAQSYTFINPAGEWFAFLLTPGWSLVSFGMAALAGVVAGSFIYSLITGTFRFEWFSSWHDLATHLAAGVLMGIGGVLAMGCTVGQAISGFATLALGSLLTFLAIILGSALTMKVQLYRMMYEGEANLFSALVTSLADFRLLPKALRRHDPV